MMEKRKYKVICKIEFHNLIEKNNLFELLKFRPCKIIIDGKSYYIGDIDASSVTFIEIEPSEHEIEIVIKGN